MTRNQSYRITAAVGAPPGAVSHRPDVEIIQKLLNEHAARVGYAPVAVNGIVGPPMIQATRTFLRDANGQVPVRDGNGWAANKAPDKEKTRQGAFEILKAAGVAKAANRHVESSGM